VGTATLAIILATVGGLPLGDFSLSNLANAAYYYYGGPPLSSEITLVRISDATLALDAPQGSPVVVLPADADNNGFDTYRVMEVRTIGQVKWLGLFMGGPNPLWVTLEQVYICPDLVCNQ
jgi:hypothetical protein